MQKKKLKEKKCDWIIANDVSDDSIGFDSEQNSVTIYYKENNQEKIKKMSKAVISDIIVEKIINQIN